MKTSTIPTLLGPDGMTSLREYAGYHGGGSGFGGQLRAWNPPSESVDAALLPNFTRGNARADDLVRNNGYAANAIQLHQDHIVGSFFRLSHRPSWRYLGIGEEEARAFSREVEAAWKEFAEDDCCCIDVERKRTFTMMIREGVAMHAFNGELFVQATWDTSSSRLFRTQFRMVSPKRISNPNNTGDIRQETLNECTRAEQSASVVLWEIDLTEVGGERYFFCNEQNEKGEPVTWQGRQYQPYPIQGSGFELNGKGTSTRPTLTVSNLYGMVTGMAEDLQSLVGGTVVRRKVYARFLDAVNFVNGNSDADPEQEVISRWRIEQCSELSAVSASFVLSTPTETDGAVFPGRIMLANTCTWTYRGDECGYHGPAVADEYDQPTSDITKDKCSKCLSGCKFRNNVGNFGGFLSINKLSQ